MPKYIDAEKFLESTISRFKCVPLIGVPKSRNGEEYFDGEDFEQVLNQTPTEDVVPRSEYDAVVSAVDNSTKEFLKLHDNYQSQKIELEAMRGAANSYKLHYEKAKQEVAKQIFEEIENIFIDGCEVYHTMEPEDFAELKKKYIGE